MTRKIRSLVPIPQNIAESAAEARNMVGQPARMRRIKDKVPLSEMLSVLP